MRRRQFLRTAATAATATATATATTTAAATAATTAVGTFLTGCLGDPATSTTDSTAPATDSTTATSTGTATAADDCPDVTRLSFRYDSVEQESLVLRASADSVAVGDSLSLDFRNLASVAQTTGSRDKVDVQRQTADGWRSVFGRPSGEVWTAEAITHDPGEGFDWELSVGEGGCSFAEPLHPQYRSCSPVESGQYRFVFWGIIDQTDGERETDAALTRRFRVTDS